MSMNRDTDLLLQSGIAAVRSGDKREGARLLAQVVRKEPQSEDAWFWLAAATDQPAEAAACLRRVLAINPNNARARQALNMLDTGQGQAAFSTGPLENEQNGDAGNRPLSTNDLASPYNGPSQPMVPPVASPTPPPPPFGNERSFDDEPTVTSVPAVPPAPAPFGNNPYGNNPYGGEPTVPSTPPPFTYGEMPADPYGGSTAPSPQPVQSNLPPPPPFTGGSGVRLGQLDPNASFQPNNPNIPGPNVYDPGAELRASLLPTTPVNAVPPPPGQVVVVKKRRRLNPLLLVLAAIVVLLLVGLIAFLLLRNNNSTTVADVPVAGQTATAAVALTATSTAQGTPGVSGTGAAANGTPGAGGTGVANGTPGVNGTGAANGTPGLGNTGAGNVTPGGATNGTPGGAANGTPGPGGNTSAANGTPGANATSGNGTTGNNTSAAGTVQPGGATPTAQSGQPGNTSGTGTASASTPGTGGQTPANGTPIIAPGMGTEAPPPTVRDNRPPPEVVDYVNNTARYINNAQFFEAAIAEGIVKPYRAGRIKPGVTRINMPPVSIPGSSISQIVPSSVFSSTNGTRTNATSTPVPSQTAGPSASANANGTPGTPGATGGAGTATPRPTSTVSTTAGANTTPGTPAPNVPTGARQVIVNGPNGPEVGYLVDFTGTTDMNRMTLSLGQIARVLKDQSAPAGAFDLNQVSLEYANDLSNMSNALDMFFQSGKVSYLDELSNYYDKAVRDRDRWASIVTNGYPFHIIL